MDRFSIIREGGHGPDSMLSVPHLIIIFLVALIVLGPEKLPQVARTLTKAMGEFREATGGLRETFEEEMRNLEREMTEAGQSPRPAPPAKPALSEASNPLGEAGSETVDSAEAPENDHLSLPADYDELKPTAEDPFPAESEPSPPPATEEADARPPEPEENSRVTTSEPGKTSDGHSSTST